MANRHACLTRALAVSILLSLCVSALAQDQEKPKLKDFGSSLKRIKWDPKKNAAVEVKPKSDAKASSDEIDVVKVETSLVSNDVLVLDTKANPVVGLTEKDFAISEDGQPQRVGMFSLGDNINVSRSIVLVIDYSGSMTPYLNMSIAAAKVLIDQLQPQDRVAVVTDDVKLLVGFTHDKHLLKSKLDSLKTKAQDPAAKSGWFGGHSLQYSALMATLHELFDDEDQRPIIIFQTDGDQLGFLRNSPMPAEATLATIKDREAADRIRKRIQALYVNFSLDDICRASEKARATIYTVIPGHQLLGHSTAEQIAISKAFLHENFRGAVNSMTDDALEFWAQNQAKLQSSLAAVSTSTGGWTMFLEKPEDADHIYATIFSDINRRYIVGYYPTNKEHDGKRRKIEVTVRDHPEYVVVGRRWYYAPAADQ